MDQLLNFEGLFTVGNLFTLFMLVMLQAVLGFDNLLYISLESKRAPADRQSYVRKLGIGLAIILRVLLLLILVTVIEYFQEPLGELKIGDFLFANPNIHSLIVLVGGVFILYTAVKEIWHLMIPDSLETDDRKPRSINSVIAMIVIMNLVFSFDSILSAMALSDHFWVMAIAIIIGGLLMIWLADRVSNFLRKNRMYEVLGLFVLFLVGVMLLTEGGHMAELTLFGFHITPMSKTTFYFIIFILVMIDLVQGRYQRKLLAAREAKQ